MKIESLPSGSPPSASTRAADPRAATAAKFEGLFVREMLKSMRAARLDDGLLETQADTHWADMRDQMFADMLAARSPMGVAKTLARTTPGAPPAGTPRP